MPSKPASRSNVVVLAGRELDVDPVLVLVDGADRDAEADLDAGAFDGPEQDFVQLQAGQGAECRHPVVAEQELVLHDQPSIGIEQPHAVIAEAGGEDFVEHAERVVDAQRIGGLAEADARDIERRPPLDQHDLDAPPRQRRRSGQSADTAADHENTPNVAHHGSPLPPAGAGALFTLMGRAYKV